MRLGEPRRHQFEHPELIAGAELRIFKASGHPMHQAASDRYERIEYARCGRSGLHHLNIWGASGQSD
jgi:hypothetical protein